MPLGTEQAGGNHEHRILRPRAHGRRDGEPVAGPGRETRDLEPDAGARQAAAGARRNLGAESRRNRAAQRPGALDPARRERRARGLSRRGRPAIGRHQGQALRRDEHRLAGAAAGTRRRGEGQGRRSPRMSGRRDGGTGARGQAARHGRRQCFGFHPGQAGARPALPQGRACRRQRRGRRDEAGDQSAALHLLGGARRGDIPHPRFRHCARQDAGDFRRELGRHQRPQGARPRLRQGAGDRAAPAGGLHHRRGHQGHENHARLGEGDGRRSPGARPR